MSYAIIKTGGKQYKVSVGTKCNIGGNTKCSYPIFNGNLNITHWRGKITGRVSPFMIF